MTHFFTSTVAVLSAVLLSWTNAYGQTDSSLSAKADKEKYLDYIVLKAGKGDTIWCSITDKQETKLFYTTPNKDEWVKDLSEIKFYKWNSKQEVLKKIGKKAPSETVLKTKHKITYTTKIITSRTKGSFGASGSTSTSEVLASFTFGDSVYDNQKILIKILSSDKEAYKIIRKYKKHRTIKTILILSGLSVAATTFYLIAKDDNLNHAAYAGGATAIIMISAIICASKEEFEYLEQAIDVYNKSIIP